MIDFISTRDDVDPSLLPYARFLAAMVAGQVRAASKFPDFMEIDHKKNYRSDAREAIEYLFEEGSEFETHMELLGGSAASVRAALTSDRELPVKGAFNARDREAIQLRLQYWKHATQPTETA